MSPRRLFIAGATGAVGRVLVPMADRHGISVVPHVRPKSASSLAHPNVVAIDLGDAGLPAAMQGCTTVVQLIGTMKKRFAKGDTYETSDIGTTRQLVEAAKRAGVDHLVLLSSVGAGRPMGAYLEAKAKAESLVKESGIAFTIVRPSAFAETSPGTVRHGFGPSEPGLHLKISLSDLAEFLLALVDDPRYSRDAVTVSA